MKTTHVPFDSDALRANIATTAQNVVIPDRYLPLVEAVEGLRRAHFSHRDRRRVLPTFRNADLLIEGFEIILLRNWTYFERSENRARLFGLLSELVLGLLETPLTASRPRSCSAVS